MNHFERHRILPSWDCSLAGEMGKSNRKWRKLLSLRYSFISPAIHPSLQNKSILETKKQQELNSVSNISILKLIY